jgi:hypothetical protein
MFEREGERERERERLKQSEQVENFFPVLAKQNVL